MNNTSEQEVNSNSLAVFENKSLSDLSETDSSVVESVSSITNGHEVLPVDAPRQESNIGHIIVRESNDVTIGTRIIYNGPVTIHQHQSDQQRRDNDQDRLAEILNRSAVVTETSEPLRIVGREEWFARPPEREMELLTSPAIRVIIACTMGKTATTHRECAETVRGYQAEHIEMRGWDDISYNFLVGANGSIFVGRGWDYKGAHSRIYNQRSICIAFIGNFFRNPPPERSFIAVQQLIAEGVKMGKLANDYRLYGHRQLIPTTSPGNKVYDVIRTWDHWTEEVIPP